MRSYQRQKLAFLAHQDLVSPLFEQDIVFVPDIDQLERRIVQFEQGTAVLDHSNLVVEHSTAGCIPEQVVGL